MSFPAVGPRLVLILVALGAAPLAAHEVRPAYLEVREEAPGEFSVLWKTPMRGDLRLALQPRFSGEVELTSPVATRQTADAAALETWRFRAATPLRGRSVRIDGLDATLTDSLVRIEFADGGTWVHRLTPQHPSAEIPRASTAYEVALVYLKLGVEHILLGVDHLFFVFSLLLLTRGVRRLIATVTAFTVAHSITLGLATLGVVHMPQAPVEAVIALSIVFVAAEILRRRQGQEGLAARAPWLVAFGFGLLHGLGFAGALAAIGLPHGHIPLALLCFNLGVEVGQLVFVAAVLALAAVARRLRPRPPLWAEAALSYAIGGIAMFWVIQRVAAF